jgi:FkbM family methyltransferase
MGEDPDMIDRQHLLGRHPIFERFSAHAGPVHGSFWTDFLGVRGRRSFHTHYDESNGVGYLQPQVQPITSEYFEWVALLCAVAVAREPFTMFELGSGWGRWLLRGALACRQLDKEFHLVGVEAESRHFEWMRTAFRDNGLDPGDHLLVNAAIGGKPGEGWFMSGNAREWYGQSLLSSEQLEWAKREAARFQDSGTPETDEAAKAVQQVPIIPLSELLQKYPRTHLLNMDIQNAEADVVEGSADEIDARVELAHISTHSPAVERRLRAVFGRLGWIKVFDFEGQGQRNTPYGEVGFVDGVQTWINPTATHVLDSFCHPALLRFCVVQNCYLQQQRQHDLDLHALEVRALESKLQTATREKEETELVVAQLQRELERERNVTVLRVLGRRVKRVASGVQHRLRPESARKSA